MTNGKFKPIIENKKPFEEVQEIDNHLSWEEQLETEEQEMLENFVYEAEAVEVIEAEETLPYTATPPSRPADRIILVGIEFKNCYLTDASACASFLWWCNKTPELIIYKIRGVRELLAGLETGKFRIVNRRFGLETEHTSSLKNKLEEAMKGVIDDYEQGEEIRLILKIEN